MGFKGSKKNTPYAAQMAASDAAKTAFDAGVKKVDVFVKGPGAGRESSIRALSNSGIEVVMIKDMTPLATQRLQTSEEKKSLSILYYKLGVRLIFKIFTDRTSVTKKST